MNRCIRVFSWVILICFTQLQTESIAGYDIWNPPPVAIPMRPAEAITGSEFLHLTGSMTFEERQKAAVEELIKGNIPDFLRKLSAITISNDSFGGGPHQVIVWVMPDYLSIGCNEDFIRIPLSYHSAITVLNHFNGIPPTAKLVDEIYAQSRVHLKPQPLMPGSQMRSNAYYLYHQNLIERQRRGEPLGVLTAGHKKDVVITNRLLEHQGKVAIYGWHREEGDPIQPLSTVHPAEYEDYSHGIRFVSQTVLVEGKPRSIVDMLQDPKSASLLTYEGYLKHLAL